MPSLSDYIAQKLSRFPTVQYDTASSHLGLSPQEQFLYQHHLNNLINGGYFRHPSGGVSTVLQRPVEHQGRYYNIPSVWGGQILSEMESRKRASAMGWQTWPSYSSWQDADARYMQMHDYMAQDLPAVLGAGANVQAGGARPLPIPR